MATKRQRREKRKRKRSQAPPALPPSPPKSIAPENFEEPWWRRIPGKLWWLIGALATVVSIFACFPALEISIDQSDPVNPMLSRILATNSGFIPAKSVVTICQPDFELKGSGFGMADLSGGDGGVITGSPIPRISYHGKVTLPCPDKSFRFQNVDYEHLKIKIILKYHIGDTPFAWTSRYLLHAEKDYQGHWYWRFDD